MASINKNSIIAKVMKANKTRVAAYTKVESRVLNAKTILLNEFDDSEITKEILAGPEVQPSAVLPFGSWLLPFGFTPAVPPLLASSISLLASNFARSRLGDIGRLPGSLGALVSWW